MSPGLQYSINSQEQHGGQFHCHP